MITIKDNAISLICSAILIFQEHWLPPCDLDKLKVNVANCLPIVFSNNVIEKGMLRGRPFGGLVVYINTKYAKYAKLVHKSDRFIVVELYECSSIPDFINCTINVLSYIQNVLSIIDYSNIVLGGDLNPDWNSSNPIFHVFKQFMNDKLSKCVC